MKKQNLIHNSVVIIRKVNGQPIPDVFAIDNSGTPIDIYSPTAVSKVRNESKVAVYPNEYPNDTGKTISFGGQTISSKVSTDLAKVIVVISQIGGERAQGLYEVPELPAGLYEYEVITPGRAIVIGKFEIKDEHIYAAERENDKEKIFNEGITSPSRGYLQLPSIEVPKKNIRTITLKDKNGNPIINHVDVEVEGIKYRNYFGDGVYMSYKDVEDVYNDYVMGLDAWDSDTTYTDSDPAVRFSSNKTNNKWVAFNVATGQTADYNDRPGDSPKWTKSYPTPDGYLDGVSASNVASGTYNIDFIPEKKNVIAKVIPVSPFGIKNYQPFVFSFDNIEDQSEPFEVFEKTINPPFNVFFEIKKNGTNVTDGTLKVVQNNSITRELVNDSGYFKLWNTFDQELKISFYRNGVAIREFTDILITYAKTEPTTDLLGLNTQIVTLEIEADEEEKTRKILSINSVAGLSSKEISTNTDTITVEGYGFSENTLATIIYNDTMSITNIENKVNFISSERITVSVQNNGGFAKEGRYTLILNDGGLRSEMSFVVVSSLTQKR